MNTSIFRDTSTVSTFSLICLAAVLTLLGITPQAASASSGIPNQFYGTVTINRTKAPAGYTVTASDNGVATGASTTTDSQGRYGYSTPFMVTGNQGDTITFYVNGMQAAQTATFQPGGITNLPLAVGGTASSGIPNQFYGTVTINRTKAPAGYTVTASDNGVATGASTTTDSQGRYGYSTPFMVTGNQGDTITFYVNGMQAAQTATFQPGGITNLPLAVGRTIPATGTTTPTTTTTPTPTTLPPTTTTPTPTTLPPTPSYTPPATTTPTSSNNTTTTVQGTISAVASNSIIITPTNGGNPITLTLDAHSDINLSGETSLATGQTASATYNGQTMVAERIIVNSSMPSSSENGMANQNTSDNGRSDQHRGFIDYIKQALSWLGGLFH